MESLVVRTAGTEVHDGWVTRDVAVTDPAIACAAQRADSMIFDPGFVGVGPESISNEDFTEQVFNLLQRDTATGAIDPDCSMVLQGDFMLGAVPPDTIVGADVDDFPSPPMDTGDDVPVTGSVTSMIDWVDWLDGVGTIEQVLADIDQAWAELEADNTA